MQKFKLSQKFLEKYKEKNVNWGFNGLGYFVFKRTYARPIYDEQTNEIIRTEEWWETIQRVVEGSFSYQKQHCNNLGLPWNNQKAQRSAQIMYDKIFNFKFTPAGRGLWAVGTEFVEKNGSMSINNCAFISTENIDIASTNIFEWVISNLMVGIGIGFDTLGAGKIIIQQPAEVNPWTKEKPIFVIPDSREGWTEALRWMLKAYFNGKPIPTFDFSKIRPAGTFIKGFGGIASGPAPLKELLESINDILKPEIGNPISETIIVDLMNLIARCVVAGGVRRSAMLALGNIESDEYINLKNPKLHKEELYHHRWSSNNSIYGKIGETDYHKVQNLIVQNGEPGIVWLDNCKEYGRFIDGKDYKDMKAKGVNPCGEQILEDREVCNLIEVFPSLHDNVAEFYETLKYAYLYGKSITLVNTNSSETNAVMLKNRRIGLSLTGVMDAMAKFGRRAFLEEWCDIGYNRVQTWDDVYSDWLCIPKSKRTTTCKPSGTVSLLAGVSPGIHYPHSEYYIRRIRLTKNSPLIKNLKLANYNIEKDKYSPDTIVIEFPVKIDNFIKSKETASIWEQMNNAADIQKYWSDNAVSITVTFNETEQNEIANVLEHFEDKLKCVSFLPISKNGYVQAPYQSITKEQYEKMVSKLLPLNLSSIKEKGIGEKFCSNESCGI